MIKHHLTILYRNLKKHKSSFFINLIGLSAGLTCALLIYLWVNDEMSMDKFHTDSSRIYQVMENQQTAEGINTMDATAAILADALLKEMPEVEQATMASPAYWLQHSMFSVNGNKNLKAAGKFAGKDFFKVFSYPLLSGNINQVLLQKNTIVVSAAFAKKLFHTTDVIGKELSWRNAEMPQEIHSLISGVFKDIPGNSSDQFDFLISTDVFFNSAPNYLQWGNYGPDTFIKLRKGTDPADFNAKLSKFMLSKGVKYRELFIRLYEDAYLYSNYSNGKQDGGRITYVRLFSLIAVLILFIACINFMNLSTAKASGRMKEVGIKKVLGAQRNALIVQYLTESMVLTFLSLFMALLCVELLLPQFNSIVNKELVLHFTWQLSLVLFSITFFTGLVSGSYPALYLSGFKPAAALKGRLKNSSTEIFTRKGLVVFQFSLSVIFIVSVLVVYKQVRFVQTQHPGFQKDNVIYFETEGKLKSNINAFLKEVKKIPGVVNTSSINRDFLGDLNSTTGDFNWEGRDPKEVIKFQNASINTNFIETMGMKMIAGRSFSDQFGADSTRIIINEAGIKAMRLKDPVNKTFTLWGKDYQIAGIVKDFHFESMHQVVKPMFMRFEGNTANRVMVSIQPGKERETLARLTALYAGYNPGYTLNYHFLDQDFQLQYEADHRVSILSGYFAALAIIISCLGLFGLAAFTAERRLKEIGIRKVLGASEWNIVYILSRDFTMPVLLGIGIAVPASYIITQYWLNTFAYRIEMQIWYFVLAGLLALLISWLTVSMQAIKAATVSPINCLKEQ